MTAKPRIPAYQEATLWATQCGNCPLFDPCGGSQTAPCGCVRRGPLYKQCGTCDLVCRERVVRRKDGSVRDSFALHLINSSPLERVSLRQPRFSDLPPVILSGTDLLPARFRYDRRWVAVRMRDLYTSGGNPTLAVSSAGLRKKFRAAKDSQLLGILSAEDRRLEGFWRNPKRREHLARLKQAGIATLTGPTFSVLGETGTHPSSHNVVMLHRHHQIVYESRLAGLSVIPNLYWRSSADLSRWAQWLSAQEVFAVSRDFSLTKQATSFKSELDGLLEILHRVGRPLHVITTGVGEANAEILRENLPTVGASWSVVTARPILAAAKGVLLPDRGTGEYTAVKSSLSRAALAKENIRRFDEAVTGQRRTPREQFDLFSRN